MTHTDARNLARFKREQRAGGEVERRRIYKVLRCGVANEKIMGEESRRKIMHFSLGGTAEESCTGKKYMIATWYERFRFLRLPLLLSDGKRHALKLVIQFVANRIPSLILHDPCHCSRIQQTVEKNSELSFHLQTVLRRNKMISIASHFEQRDKNKQSNAATFAKLSRISRVFFFPCRCADTFSTMREAFAIAKCVVQFCH